MSRARRQSGVVLPVVLFFALLLVSSISTFMKRAVVDAMISHNRDAAARAEALARGGVRLGRALLFYDKLEEIDSLLPLDTLDDTWARIREVELEDGALRLTIEDTGARFNLNTLFATPGEGEDFDPAVEIFLNLMLEKVIDEMPLPPGEKFYDVPELARDLMDWVDEDEERRQGGPEEAYYQEQDPPYLPANRPLLSVDEMRLVEGFDGPLVDALRPYVTVYPYIPGLEGGGINPNTAPAHVLALIFYNDGVDEVLADEEIVSQILEVREDGGFVCASASEERCTPMNEIIVNEPFPAVSYTSTTFRIQSEARIGEVRRTVVAVVDRSNALEMPLLSWRVR